jgi:hypothetical protein
VKAVDEATLRRIILDEVATVVESTGKEMIDDGALSAEDHALLEATVRRLAADLRRMS